MKRFFVLVACLLCFVLCSCEPTEFFTSGDRSGDSEGKTEAYIDDSDLVLDMLTGLTNLNYVEDLAKFSKDNFENSTLVDYLAGKREIEVNLLMKVFKTVKFNSCRDGIVRYTVISPDFILDVLQNDQNFVKEYNNLLTIGISEEEMRDYLINYLGQVVDSAAETGLGDDGVVENTTAITVSGKKLSSDVFLVQLAEQYLTELIEKVKATTFTETTEEDTIDLSATSLEVGKGITLPYSVYDESNSLVNSVKIFVRINEVLTDDSALEKLNELNPVNSKLQIDYAEDTIVYVNYSISNYSGTDLNYSNNFIAVDEKGNSYTLPLGTVLGITPNSVCKNGEETTLDVVIVCPKNASIGYYDSASKNFYRLKSVE